MSLTSKFIQSLIALTASMPAAAAAPPPPAPTVSAGPAASVDFAPNLSTKLAGVRPAEPARFGQCWPRTDFAEVQRAIPAGPAVSTMSPSEAFRRVTDRA